LASSVNITLSKWALLRDISKVYRLLTQLAEALLDMPEGHRVDSRWGH